MRTLGLNPCEAQGAHTPATPGDHTTLVGSVWERTELEYGPVSRRYLVSACTAYRDGQEEIAELVRLHDGAELKMTASQLRAGCWKVGQVAVATRHVRHGDGRPMVVIGHYDLRAAVEAARAL